MKKIMIILGLIGVITIGYGIVNTKLEKNNEKVTDAVEVKEESDVVEEKEEEKIATPPKEEVVKRETIVIDPGHSSNPSKGVEPIFPGATKQKEKDVSGAVGISSKVPEYELTHNIGNLLKDDLEKRGFNVIMTKTKVEEQRSNIQRAEIGNNANAALLIRIHADSFSSSSVSGASMLVPSKYQQSTAAIASKSWEYGKIILDSYLSKVPIKNKGVIERSDLTGFNWSKVPVVLIEMGFLSNPQEDNFLNNPANYNSIVSGIGEGIDKCFPKS